MKLLRFSTNDRSEIGIGLWEADHVYDLSEFGDGDTRGVAEMFASGMEGVRQLDEWKSVAPRLPFDQVDVRAPVDHRTRIFCAALNYASHAAEVGRPIPKEPLLFLKLPSGIIDPGAEIRIPPVTEFLDYEGELVVVMAKRAKNVPTARAWEHVMGFIIMNDVSARDLQKRQSKQEVVMDWFSGKGLDQTTPVGPAVVTLDECKSIEEIELITRLNGTEVQRTKVGDMIFSIPDLIAYVSNRVELLPMDLIATGTPARSEGHVPRPLRFGDVIDVEVTGVGHLRNLVID